MEPQSPNFSVLEPGSPKPLWDPEMLFWLKDTSIISPSFTEMLDKGLSKML